MVRIISTPTRLRMKHYPQAWQRVERWRFSVPASIPTPATDGDDGLYPHPQQRVQRWRSSASAPIPAPVTGRDNEFYPQTQQRAERPTSLDPVSVPAPVTGRDDEFYLTDEMAVFQVCDYLIRFVSQSLTHHDAAFFTMSLYSSLWVVGREPAFPCSPVPFFAQLPRIQLHVLAPTWG
jgi:hypothetical protein